MIADTDHRSARLTPYAYDDTLYGRSWEVKHLYSLLVAERLVLLYAPSGAGKTSLLQAGLIKRLKPMDPSRLRVERAPIRVSLLPKQARLGRRNRFVASTLLALNAHAPNPLPEHELLRYRLDTYMPERYGPSGPPVVLIFDQFEEILTVDAGSAGARQQFFAQLRRICADQRFWVVLTVREDYLARLDPFLAQLSPRPFARFRLGLLDAAGATEVLIKEARKAQIVFRRDAARELVRRLCTIEMVLPDGRIASQEGRFVEPVQLQAVIPRLLTAEARAAGVIGPAEVKATDVREALGAYYDEHIAQITASEAAARTGWGQRELRGWVQQHLLTTTGQRSFVPYSPEAQAVRDLPVELVNALVDCYLLRKEPLRNMVMLELSHDQLVRPVWERNLAWLERNTHSFQEVARLWIERGSPELLLSGSALASAQRWVASRSRGEADGATVTAGEGEFLAVSARQQELRRGLNMKELGWGVIFASDESPAVIAALQPLLDLRKAQASAGDDYSVGYHQFDRWRGHHVDADRGPESGAAWQSRLRSGASTLTLPYYLLIVGSPRRIPFEFQYDLAIRHAVGRIHFAHPDDYGRYAASVITAEMSPPAQTGVTAMACPDYGVDTVWLLEQIFGAEALGRLRASTGKTDAELLSQVMLLDEYAELASMPTLARLLRIAGKPLAGLVCELLVRPLADRLSKLQGGSAVGQILGAAATRAALAELLATAPPHLLVAAGSGYDVPGQPRGWGSIALHDWDGKGIAEIDQCFSAADLPEGRPLAGMIALLIASNSAGFSPTQNVAASISSLARALLAHQPSGVLAVVGHIDENYSYAYSDDRGQRPEIGLFARFAEALLDGQTVGRAMAAFAPRYAALLSARAGELMHLSRGMAELLDGPAFEQITAIERLLAEPGSTRAEGLQVILSELQQLARATGQTRAELQDYATKVFSALHAADLEDLRKYVIVGDPAARLPIE